MQSSFSTYACYRSFDNYMCYTVLGSAATAYVGRLFRDTVPTAHDRVNSQLYADRIRQGKGTYTLHIWIPTEARHSVSASPSMGVSVNSGLLSSMNLQSRDAAAGAGCHARPRGCHPGAYSTRGCCPNTLLASMPAVTAPVGAVRTVCPNAGWLIPAQAQPYIADSRLSRFRTRQSVLRRLPAREMGTSRPQGSCAARAKA